MAIFSGCAGLTGVLGVVVGTDGLGAVLAWGFAVAVLPFLGCDSHAAQPLRSESAHSQAAVAVPDFMALLIGWVRYGRTSRDTRSHKK